MGDPFKLDGIRGSIPQPNEPLELHGMRNIIDELVDKKGPVEENGHDDDVSMVDAPEAEPKEHARDTEMQDPIVKQSGRPERAAGTKRSERTELSDPEPDAPSAETNNSLGEPVSVLSPTRMGSRKALSSERGSLSLGAPRHVYELDMPIPVPWHHNLPYVLSTYLQLGFNICIGLLGLWLAFEFNRDAGRKLDEKANALSREASACAQLYIDNECRPGLVRPALREYCSELEICMDKDPASLRRLTAYAGTMSEIFNEFFEPLTYRTLLLLCVFLVVMIFSMNYLFGFWRAKTYYRIVAHPPTQEPARAQYKVSSIPAMSMSEDMWSREH